MPKADPNDTWVRLSHPELGEWTQARSARVPDGAKEVSGSAVNAQGKPLQPLDPEQVKARDAQASRGKKSATSSAKEA